MKIKFRKKQKANNNSFSYRNINSKNANLLVLLAKDFGKITIEKYFKDNIFEK